MDTHPELIAAPEGRVRRGTTFERTLRIVLLTVVTSVALAAPGAAWGTTGHGAAGTFGGSGAADGLFSPRPAGLGIGPSGDVFVLDRGDDQGVASPRVQRFDASGAFASSFDLSTTSEYADVTAGAVDPSGSGAVYVVAQRSDGNGTDVLRYDVDGTLAYPLDFSTSGTSANYYGNAAIAVDPADGSVYVAASDGDGLPVVDRFDGSTGAFVSSFDGSSNGPDGRFACLSSLAVDSAHQVYVLDPCKGRVDAYTPAGAYVATVDDGAHGTPRAVAADPLTNEVYVAESAAQVAGLAAPHVTQFTAGGAGPNSTFDLGETLGLDGVVGVVGLAVSSAGTVYVADSTNVRVARFTRFDGPTVITGGTTSPEPRAVTLQGTIDPQGVASTFHFEYGTGLSYGSRTDESPPQSGTGAMDASAAITGLRPSTTYNYRIVGTNASGSIDGVNSTFTTAPAPPTLDGVPPATSAISARTARIHGSVNPNSAPFWSYNFEYGTTTAYGSTAPGGFFFGGGGSDVPEVAQLSDLQPDTLYHFRIVADNGTPPVSQGIDQTFVTAPAASGGASALTSTRATLTGVINPHGKSTTYHFNYGPTMAYGATTEEVNGGGGDGDQPVTQPVAELLPDTTYHVQVVAASAGVTRYGADGLFRTAPAPSAVAISPIGVSTSTATLIGDVDTHGLPGTYRFDIRSLDGSYASSTVERPVSGNASSERVAAPIEQLPAGQTFVVQLSVTSNDATQLSDLIIFATPALPRVFPTNPTGDTSSYACAVPRLNSYNTRPKPGEALTVSGTDLGVGGTAILGDRALVPSDWSTTGFKLDIPPDAAGTLALTVNCGHVSNTIAIAIYHEAENSFAIPSRSVSGATATLSVRVPGPGKVETSGTKTKATKTTIVKASTATVKVKLSSASMKALSKAESRKLKVAIRVRFTPAGGEAANKTLTLTFRRNAGRSMSGLSERGR